MALTERQLAQRRTNTWRQGTAHRAEVNKRRKQVDENIRQRMVAQGGYYKLTDKQENANITRLNKVWGIPIVTIINNRLQEVPFSNPALQSFLKKWSNQRAKGISPDQAVAVLEHRYENVRRRDQMGTAPTMLDLIRENYPASRREVRRHRRQLTDRQREAKRLRDADYRERKRRRAA